MRNPWRFSFDRRTGDLAIGEVGQDETEEVDFVRGGRAGGLNFGWRAYEGRHLIDRSVHVARPVMPVLEYSHAGGNCSVTGGYVVRDPRIAALRGRYLYADYCAGKLLSARLRAGSARDRRSLGLAVPGLTSFGEDLSGRVYVVSQQGPVYRLDPR
jgi:hypothetical protein